MIRIFIVVTLLLAMAVSLTLVGCDKEKIVESTEYIHDIEYVESPPDTIFQVDTVFVNDTTTVNSTDTIFMTDTVIQIDHKYDTVFVYDTITTVQNHYDTVLVPQCSPNELLATSALEYHCDPLVLEAINTEFGINEGWILYLSAFQLDITRQSASVYDIYGIIDYWTPDWTGFYPFEFFWRMTFNGGDPADPENWSISDPPGGVSGHTPGVQLMENPSHSRQAGR